MEIKAAFKIVYRLMFAMVVWVLCTRECEECRRVEWRVEWFNRTKFVIIGSRYSANTLHTASIHTTYGSKNPEENKTTKSLSKQEKKKRKKNRSN